MTIYHKNPSFGILVYKALELGLLYNNNSNNNNYKVPFYISPKHCTKKKNIAHSVVKDI